MPIVDQHLRHLYYHTLYRDALITSGIAAGLSLTLPVVPSFMSRIRSLYALG